MLIRAAVDVQVFRIVTSRPSGVAGIAVGIALLRKSCGVIVVIAVRTKNLP